MFFNFALDAIIFSESGKFEGIIDSANGAGKCALTASDQSY